MSSPMGTYLRQLGGGEVRIGLYLTEVGHHMVPTPHGEMPVAGQVQFLFVGLDYREIGGADIWEFDVMEKTPQGPKRMRMAVCGKDIAFVNAEGRIA